MMIQELKRGTITLVSCCILTLMVSIWVLMLWHTARRLYDIAQAHEQYEQRLQLTEAALHTVLIALRQSPQGTRQEKNSISYGTRELGSWPPPGVGVGKSQYQARVTLQRKTRQHALNEKHAAVHEQDLYIRVHLLENGNPCFALSARIDHEKMLHDWNIEPVN